MSIGAQAARVDTEIQFFALGDGGLLFSEARQEIHSLNASAAVIWCFARDGCGDEEIVAKLQHRFTLSAATSQTFVNSVFVDWRQRGLLVGASLPPDSVASPLSGQQTSPLPRRSMNDYAGERFYALLSSLIRVRFGTAGQIAAVHPVLSHLQTATGDVEVAVDILQSGSEHILQLDGAEFGRCRGTEALAPLVKGAIWSTAVNRHDFFLGIHAGVVADRSGAMLLPGSPGSGKSSLTAALVHAGFQYYSDEMALLRDGDLFVVPVPFSLCIKDTGLDVLGARFPHLRELPLHDRADGKRVAYLPPPGSAAPPDAAKPVRAVLFPRFIAGAATTTQIVSKADALQRLLTQCLVVRRRLDSVRIRALIEWIEPVQCVDLVFGDLDQAAAAAALFADLPEQAAVGCVAGVLGKKAAAATRR